MCTAQKRGRLTFDASTIRICEYEIVVIDFSLNPTTRVHGGSHAIRDSSDCPLVGGGSAMSPGGSNPNPRNPALTGR